MLYFWKLEGITTTSAQHSFKPVTGGAVQGSVLGVLDHNAVIEFADEDASKVSTNI